MVVVVAVLIGLFVRLPGQSWTLVELGAVLG
jgi:hypothetical protein